MATHEIGGFLIGVNKHIENILPAHTWRVVFYGCCWPKIHRVFWGKRCGTLNKTGYSNFMRMVYNNTRTHNQDPFWGIERIASFSRHKWSSCFIPKQSRTRNCLHRTHRVEPKGCSGATNSGKKQCCCIWQVFGHVFRAISNRGMFPEKRFNKNTFHNFNWFFFWVSSWTLNLMSMSLQTHHFKDVSNCKTSATNGVSSVAN